jgi:hypothetical protein
MFDTYRKLRDLLDRRERRNAFFLFVMMLFVGFMETMGVASIMPFIAVVSKPEVIRSNAVLDAIYEMFGFSSVQSFLFFLGSCVFVLVVCSLGFKALTHYARKNRKL